jgi:hypothetical protein
VPLDAFISHSTKDGDLARTICEGLEERGLRCWLATRDVPPGGTYGAEIIKGIRESNVFLLLLSTASSASTQVEREAERASHYEKRIIPIVVDTEDPGTNLEYFVAGRQRFRYSRDGQFLDTLAAVVRGQAAAAPAVEPAPVPSVATAPAPARRLSSGSKGRIGALRFGPNPRQPSRIYISYRRDDAVGAAGRLSERLSAVFGADKVIADIDFPHNVDFVKHIESQVRQCKAVLVVIGRQWLTISDGQGQRRLSQEDDFVRLEVAAALRSDQVVVPVLVDGADIPQWNELPEDLRPLTERQAFKLTRWNEDVASLIEQLHRALDES